MTDDHDLSFSVDELSEGNIDWYAAACIYVEETSVLPILTGDGHRRRGFRGTSKLTVDVSTAAFCREVPNRQMYRFFTIEKPPLLSVSLDYVYDNKNSDEGAEGCYRNEDDDDEEVHPTNLQIQFEHYPEEWPTATQSSHLTWLTTKCQNVMNHSLYGSITYEIIQLCEHELLNFWEVLHQTDDYRLILLPSKMDNLYHSNVGVAINPRTKALQGLARSRSDEEEVLTSDREANHNKGGNEVAQRSPTLEYAERALLECWTKLYHSTCPICFETTRCDMGITLPCTCFFCEDCLPQYLHVKVSELDGYKRNPFKCPSLQCRTELCLEKVVKPLISNEDIQLIKRWERNLEFPPCYVLDRCPSKSCKSNQIHCDNTTNILGDVYNKEDNKEDEDEYIIRRTSKDAKNKFIFCEICDKVWCELCMRRIPRNTTREEHLAQCEIQQMTKFCRRYLRASGEMKLKCEEMYPWIVAYSRGVQDDFGVTAWLLENGQSCPNCAVGVERIEGCFHMTCPTCATHFCYECGQEIFYPFYGTHHCWEEQAMFEQFQ